MPGACSPAFGAAMAASSLLPNLYSLGDESLPSNTAFARRLFFKAGNAPMGAPVVACRNRSVPEAALSPALAARMADALLSGDARKEAAVMKEWQARASCGATRVARSFETARAAMDESTGFWGGEPGTSPPLAVALVLAHLWLRAKDKSDLWTFAEALREARPREVDVRAMPAVKDVERWWTGLRFDASEHEAVLDGIPAATLAVPGRAAGSRGRPSLVLFTSRSRVFERSRETRATPPRPRPRREIPSAREGRSRLVQGS